MKRTPADAVRAAFYDEVLATGQVWLLRDSDGVISGRAPNGAMRAPFWSSRERAHSVGIAASVAAITVDDWCRGWLPRFAATDVAIGLNWSGRDAEGIDVPAVQVLQELRTARPRRRWRRWLRTTRVQLVVLTFATAALCAIAVDRVAAAKR